MWAVGNSRRLLWVRICTEEHVWDPVGSGMRNVSRCGKMLTQLKRSDVNLARSTSDGSADILERVRRLMQRLRGVEKPDPPIAIVGGGAERGPEQRRRPLEQVERGRLLRQGRWGISAGPVRTPRRPN